MPNSGQVEMVGEAVGKSMVLTGAWRVQGLFRPQTYLLRDTYSPKLDGTITLQSQASDDQGLTWSDSGVQIYRPKE